MRKFAEQWGRFHGVAEIRVPAGFPLIYMNVVHELDHDAEAEILLPTFVLNPNYEIVSAKFTASLVGKTWEVTPTNALTYSPQSEQNFETYQRRYREAVCAQVSSVDYLQKICLRSNEEKEL